MSAERESSKREVDALAGSAAIPRKNGELVFDAPWQSRAFGMAIGLHQQGLFTWDEFRDRLIAEIGAASGVENSLTPATLYYQQWLSALEKLLVDKRMVSATDLDARAAELKFDDEPDTG